MYFLGRWFKWVRLDSHGDFFPKLIDVAFSNKVCSGASIKGGKGRGQLPPIFWQNKRRRSHWKHEQVHLDFDFLQSWTFLLILNFVLFFRSTHEVVEIDNFLYSFGGNDGSASLNSMERYDIKLNKWVLVTSMSARRLVIFQTSASKGQESSK